MSGLLADISSITVALSDSESRLTVESVQAQVAEICRTLPRERSVILSFLPPSVDALLVYFASLAGGHVSALFPAHLSIDAKLRISDAYAAEVVFDSPNRLAAMNERLQCGRVNLSSRVPMWITGRTGDEPHADVAVLLSTSGTTGNPKTVQLSKKGLRRHAEAVAESLALRDDDRAALTLPICYSYGLSIVNSHLIHGNAINVPSGPPTHERAIRFMTDSGCTSFSGVPSMYGDLVRRGTLGTLLAGGIRALTQAGGALDIGRTNQVADMAQASKAELHVMYGQTEASGRITSFPVTRVREKVGSVGLPINDVSLAIDPDSHASAGTEGGARPDDVVGEIVIRGPGVMRGYATSRQSLHNVLECLDELRTGDLGKVDADGYLYWCGRRSRYVKVESMRVSLDDLETLCNGVDEVAAVSSRKHDDVILVATTRPNGSTEHRQLRRLLDDTLPRWGLTRRSTRLVSVAVLPRLGNGKIDYAALRDLDA